MPDLVLGTGGGWRSAAKHEVHFLITSDLILRSKEGASRPFTMRATRLDLSWRWYRDEWHLNWFFHGHRWRTTKSDWSPHEQGFMSDQDIDLPDWVLPLAEANAPLSAPVVIVGLAEREVR